MIPLLMVGRASYACSRSADLMKRCFPKEDLSLKPVFSCAVLHAPVALLLKVWGVVQSAFPGRMCCNGFYDVCARASRFFANA